MEITYTDQKISELIGECKKLPENWQIELEKSGSLYVIGEDGNRFRIIIRQNPKYPSDFSAILAVVNPRTGTSFRLRRYNGIPKRPHNNKLEKEKIYGYHIHIASERYQKRGYDEDTYAVETNQYDNLQGALWCLIEDTNFKQPLQLGLKLL